MDKKWFETWFDTDEYHELYKDRNDDEAEAFVNNLIKFLNPPKGSSFLDIACGKGRHAKNIFDQGYNVVGYDLSQNSINEAKKLEKTNLRFYQHDMRKLLWTNYFDYALNLFTSFGYFDSELDEKKAINSAVKSLKPNGTLVIDFLNREKVIAGLIPNETKIINGTSYDIKKEIINNQVIKTITYHKEGEELKYHEKVKLLGLDDFKKYLNEVGFEISAIFGDYDLSLFDKETSNRLIIVARNRNGNGNGN